MSAVTTRAQVIGSIVSADVTDETLAAAKAGDRDAGASILDSLEDRFRRLAQRTATQAISDERAGLRAAYIEDFIQDAHLVAWECLLKCQDESLDGYYAYAYATAERELAAAARDMKNGTDDDPDGKKLFGLLVKHFRELDARHSMTEDDYLTLAESACQDLQFLNGFRGGAYGGRRGSLSADRAYAARLAYQGSISIHTPIGSDSEGTVIADTLSDRSSVDDAADTTQVGYRPFLWTQAVRALESNLSVPREESARKSVFTALDRFRAGTVTEEDLELFEGLPCRSASVGSALGMLRAVYTQRQEGPAPSTAAKQEDAALGRGSIALTAQRAILEKATEDAVKRALVRRVVGMLSDRQGYVLAATFGFLGKFKDDAAVARAMVRAGHEGMDAEKVYKTRSKARAAFAKKWADLIARSGDQRAALEAAATKAGVDMAEALED
ncbi:hypothetical protein ACFYMO_00695 [Streptomyces sp. NPDC007025]|uniref:hypothetical protein n=1 Tax=Streptomyces sp. NPDC007025 TaxID=3364771 RepID=UPI0036C5DEC1